MIDKVTGLQTLNSLSFKLKECIENDKEMGYLFFEIVDFEKLKKNYENKSLYETIHFLGKTMGRQKGKLYREDDFMVSDNENPVRFILLLTSPPRYKPRYSDADLKLVSSRIMQKLKTLVQDISSYDEIGDNIYFDSGFSLIKGYEISNADIINFEIIHREALIHANMEKIMTNLISNVSHELRTPLTCIIGYAESLLEGAMHDAGLSKKFIKIISDEAHRLEKLINDLLDLSMIDSRQVRMVRKETNICNLIKTTYTVLQAHAKKQNIQLNYNAPKKSILVDIDANRMRQVLVILIDNAIKYSKENGVVSIIIEKSGKELLIHVKDNGIGIPETEKDRIFERFYRLETKQRKKEGRGLGLSIAKQIVEAHGGNITVSSIYGEGSNFTIHLPMPIQYSNENNEEYEENFQGEFKSE